MGVVQYSARTRVEEKRSPPLQLLRGEGHGGGPGRLRLERDGREGGRLDADELVVAHAFVAVPGISLNFETKKRVV